MANIRQRLSARVLHWYPLASGCGTLANHRLLQAMCGDSREEVWAKTSAGNIRCSLGDYVGRAAYYVGDLDPKVTWIVRRLVKPGDVALDIGANVGLVTLMLARQVGQAGRVHAFEPNPTAASFLRQSLLKNDLRQVTLHECGLGSEARTMTLSVPASNAGAASFVRMHGGGGYVNVAVHTLDSIVARERIERIDFIKMDVEGFETDVMLGARNVLRELRPGAILFELNEPGVDPHGAAIVDLLRQMDYGLFSLPRCWFRVRLDRFEPVDRSPASNDFLAVPRKTYEATARLMRAGV